MCVCVVFPLTFSFFYTFSYLLLHFLQLHSFPLPFFSTTFPTPSCLIYRFLNHKPKLIFAQTARQSSRHYTLILNFEMFSYIYTYIYISVTVIVVRNGIGDQNSNPRQDCKHFTSR